MFQKYFFIVLTLVAASPFAVLSQDAMTGSLTGLVFDAATKEPLPGANVIVVGTTYGASTNLEGEFVITGVPVGTYAIQASVIGFAPLVRTDVVVSPVKPVQLAFGLVETAIELGEITVRAAFFQKQPDKPVSLQTQSYEEIRRLPGGLEDVVRAVSILPGVAQAQAGRNDLIVRGGAPSENLFVVDNIEIPNINHFGTQGASGGPLSFINLDFVSETAFSSGGFGVRFGDKLSSVLTINLQEGRTDRLGGKATISASQFGLNTEGPLDRNGSFLFSARRSYLDFIFKAAGFGFVPEYWDFLGKASYRLGTHDRITVLGIAALDNVRLFNETPEQRFDNSRILSSDQTQAVGGVSWRRLLDHGFFTLTLGQVYVEYNFQQSDTLLRPLFRNSSYESETSLRGDLVLQLSKTTELSAGLQARTLLFRADMLLPAFQTSFGQLLSVDALYDTTAVKAGAYAQISQRFERLRATLGVRFDYFNLIEQEVVAAPRLSLSYALSDITNLNASVGRYHQAPSTIWLTAQPANRSLRYVGVDQYVLGVDHLLRSDIKASLEAYYKRYTDYPASIDRPYLVLANTGAGFGGADEGFASFGVDRLTSAGAGRAHGVELFLQKKSSDIPHYGILSISYNRSEFRGLDGVYRPSSYDQRWIVNLGGGYLFSEKWEISTKFRVASGRPYTPFNPDGTQSAVLYNSKRIVANHSLDVRIDRRWMFRTWALITYLDIQNIYNRKPVDVPRYNSRTGQLDQSGNIGILPSIGVSAEF
jgi:hypothetical protein